ncbi:DNA cross-link repair protein PSO2/SNM1 [Recurvomyces mirabilis]|uniref:DNA cross-link repair protein PSO2/SNM1 n=1 Tax=Recurvomyces mirabilis TaxID=574656 RepID=A0AAE0WPL7_9PEZI|nr:DNA cross-link repair protein PSO2/SNM1 [Recurvomyces mirabilis]KAK5152837.1 DNA cross-link repair protein PSO2/SNM1 [Recurvomyces mirabilis]
MAVKTRAAPRQTPVPTIGRQGPSSSAKKTTAAPRIKPSGKPNTSILSFFKKSDGLYEEPALFVEERKRSLPVEDVENRTPSPAKQDVWEDEERFNESGGSMKRQRVETFGETVDETRVEPKDSPMTSDKTSRTKSGPFMEESDSEQEDEQPAVLTPAEGAAEPIHDETAAASTATLDGAVQDADDDVKTSLDSARPPLIKEETSYGGGSEEFKDFEGMDDFDEDLFEEGDEFMERRYAEEQARLEEGEDEKDYDPTPEGHGDVLVKQEDPDEAALPLVGGASCPICSASLAGISEQDAGVHVNNCLDGNPTPLPEKKPPAAKATWSISDRAIKTENTASAAQYRRPQRAPKPGQADPLDYGQTTSAGGTAFNKLMSGHAEDAAWAEAAASEHASRGKPAYQRTCPFYKVMPGLSICVDAFRYGAVQGCQAYFLSHFHSDHYIGLTSSWSHGPIYCSHVTANLVRQQLRVDPKWVVDLDFDVPMEVPGTKGVKVTMINANHCPGSSLYLFEKVVGKKTNGEPRLQRILHCGDFRACRAHIQHPLLMPDVQDKLTGKTKEQKIDVCYLDTTYLNPKYAFPSQQNVIQACADMCVSLSKHSVDESDGWEQMKRRRAGEGMVKFVRKESSSAIKEEDLEDEGDDDDKTNMSLLRNPAASQQVFTTSTTPDTSKGRGRLLVVVGTYSIGKERICLGIAHALGSKIFAPPSKMRIVSALEDPELDALMTTDPRAAQVHMTPLFEIRAETLDDYLKDYFPHFTRAVGFRPSGWNYRPPTSRFLESPSVSTVLNGDNWKSNYSMKDLVPQRGSTSRASCFGVPYSEHSSFRELTMFCCALRIEKIIPTVNVGSAKSRDKMKSWCERWLIERQKKGVWKLPEDGSW